MKVLIVDDEPIAQDILRKFSQRVPYLELAGICDNAIAALQLIQEVQPDLIFLDIQMPEMSGLEMLRVLGKKNRLIIFTTAFQEYALDGYEFDIVDYLLKPIEFERFLKAVTKAGERFKSMNTASLQATPGNGAKTYVWAKEGRRKVQICIEDIIMVQALGDYMELHLPTGKVMVNTTMHKIAELLSPPLFLRINRSCIVRTSAIRSIEDMHVEISLPSKTRIPIGPSYWEELRKHIVELF